MRFADRFPDLVSDLRTRYGEAHRAYHTWAHVEALMVHFERLDWASAQTVEIALYYHDAIYQPLSATNEADSADLMRTQMADRVDTKTVDQAAAIIHATAGHQVPQDLDADGQRDCALFLDADLSILGAPWDEFQAYDQAIRQEYLMIPDDVFLPRRRAIMAGFLDRARLYLTDVFHDSHDRAARRNLRRLVASLTE